MSLDILCDYRVTRRFHLDGILNTPLLRVLENAPHVLFNPLRKKIFLFVFL